MEYPQARTKNFKTYWNKFKKYCEKENIDYLDEKMINNFLYNNYNCELLDKKSKDAYRSMQILIDINNINEYIPYKPKSETELNNYYKDILYNYLDFLKKIRNNSDNTISDKRSATIKFFIYLQDNNILTIDKLTKNEILNYIKSNYENKISARITINWNLRTLFLYFNDSNLLPNNFNILLPKIKRVKQRKLPATFEKDDVCKILDYLKEKTETTPAGYRNYAMILIAARLGIRKIDIINLKWKNIDWNNNSINIIQIKTKKQLSLPLPNDVGEAIIEYIKNERPFRIKTEDDFIFIRHRYPLINLNNEFSLTYIIKGALTNLGIPDKKYYQAGLHSFRFTLATEMLNKEVPADIISSVLGHSNLNSQKSYTRVNKNNLLKCFVEANYE